MFTNTLAPKTALLFKHLQNQRWLRSFYLAGGTALALQYGHRQSVDLDFFTEKNISTAPLVKKLEGAGKFEITNQEKNTLEGILNGVKLSFMTFPYPLQQPPLLFHGAIRLAHPLDIGLMKLGAVTGRNTKKDFIDLYLILEREQLALRQLVERLAKQFAPTTYDPYHLYKALSYFAEADKENMPKMIQKISWDKVKRFFTLEIGRLIKT